MREQEGLGKVKPHFSSPAMLNGFSTFQARILNWGLVLINQGTVSGVDVASGD